MQPAFERQALKRYYQDESVAASSLAHESRDPQMRAIQAAHVDVVNSVISDHGIEQGLELACGSGAVTRQIEELKAAVAVDSSPQMLALARQGLDRKVWTLLQADVLDLDLGETFPLVFSFRFLRYLDPKPRRRALAVVHHHLVEGGWFVFDAPNASVEPGAQACDPPLQPKPWSREELCQELDAAGFRTERWMDTMRWHGLQRAVSRLCHRGPRALGTTVVSALDRLPGRQPLEWTVVCRRLP
jgi:SAM-dependent methyltransferase